MTTRITGLYSNLDVDSLVEAGASYYQNKVDKTEQKKQILEWKQEQYQSIESDVEDFYSKYLDTTSDDSLTKSSNWNTLKFTSSDDSAVSVTGSSTASMDDYTVSVTQLASAATTTLSSSSYTAGSTISINGTDIKLDSSSTAYSTLTSSTATAAQKGAAVATAINSALGSSSTVTASYSAISGGIVLTSSTMGSSASFTVGGTTYTGKNLNATITNSSGTYTISDTENKTTSNSTTLDGLTFNFNEVTTSSTSKYLTSSSIEDLLGDNITKVDTSTSGQTTYTLTGGSKVTLKSNGDISAVDSSNNSTSAITLSDGTKIAITGSGSSSSATVTSTANNSVSITGSKDASDLTDLIDSFVSDYNTLITAIQSKTTETYDSDYQPLTDTEKSSMTDSEISTWNTQAETGLLHNDEYLNNLASDMKTAMSTFMKSLGIDIESSTGITAVDDYSTKNGTYTVDTDTLESALEDDSTYEKIKSLFTDGSSSVTQYTTTNSSSDGILARLKVSLNNQVMTSSSIFSALCGTENHATTKTTCELYKEIEDEDDLLTKYKEQLSDKEDALYEKYAKLETSLSSLDSSSSLFSSSSSS